MKRLFVSSIVDNRVVLDGERHRHLSLVLRARVGDKVDVSTGDGYIYCCKITAISASQTVLSVQQRIEDLSEPDIICDLFFGVLKGDNNDLVVQKSVELGVHSLRPFSSEFTVARDIKTTRLNTISMQAAQQCGRNRVPVVHEITTFDLMVKKLDGYDAKLFLYERAEGNSIRSYLNSLCAYKKIAVIVGAEGGFSPRECDILCGVGVEGVSMGRRILRAETASLAALTCVMYQSGNMEYSN